MVALFLIISAGKTGVIIFEICDNKSVFSLSVEHLEPISIVEERDNQPRSEDQGQRQNEQHRHSNERNRPGNLETARPGQNGLRSKCRRRECFGLRLEL